MVPTEFKTDKTCYIDPESSRVYTYGQFGLDVTRCATQNANEDESQLARSDNVDHAGQSYYETMCQIVFNLVQGNDFLLEQSSVQTDGGIQSNEIGPTETIGPAPELPVKSVEIGSKTARLDGASVENSKSADEKWPVASAMSLTKIPIIELPRTEALQTGAIVNAIRESTSKIRLATSGTTGKPKCIVHTVASLTRGVRLGAHHADDIWGLAYPLNHLAGLQVFFQALFNQNTIVQLFGLPTDIVHHAIEQHQITHVSCTPTFLKLLDSETRNHPTVQRLTTGGERCDATTLSAIKRIFPSARHRNIYALTEVGNLLVADGDQFSVPPELKDKVTVIDGSLAIHRSMLADPSVANASNSAGQGSQSGIEQKFQDDYFITGDLVEVLDEHPLKFKFAARRDDVINVGGYKVTPQQVEQCLLSIPGIRQAVVYGKKNSVTGQIVVCDVVVEPDANLDVTETKRWLTTVLPRYAVPRMINLVESLRMTESGKLCRQTKTS